MKQNELYAKYAGHTYGMAIEQFKSELSFDVNTLVTRTNNSIASFSRNELIPIKYGITECFVYFHCSSFVYIFILFYFIFCNIYFFLVFFVYITSAICLWNCIILTSTLFFNLFFFFFVFFHPSYFLIDFKFTAHFNSSHPNSCVQAIF